MTLAFSLAFGAEHGQRILPFMAVVWLFLVKQADFEFALKQRVVIFFLLLIALHLISLLWSANVDEGAKYVSRLVRYTFLPMIICLTVLKRESMQFVVTAFVLGMFVNEIISYLIYFDLYQTELSKKTRYPVGFINHIPYSVLVSFTAILILYQARHMKNTYFRAVYVIFFITMTANLVISSGRTGYAAFFGSLVVLLFSYYRFSLKNFLELLIFPAVVFGLAYSFDDAVQTRVKSSATALDQIASVENYDTNTGARIAMFSVAQDIMDQPENSALFGAGTGDILEAMEASIERTGILKRSYDHLHNSFLTAYVNVGIVGLCVLILLLLSIWWASTSEKETRFIQQLLIATIAISCFGDVILSIKETMLFFGIFVAVVLADNRAVQERAGGTNEIS
jgi:O-antigen ligase